MMLQMLSPWQHAAAESGAALELCRARPCHPLAFSGRRHLWTASQPPPALTGALSLVMPTAMSMQNSDVIKNDAHRVSQIERPL